MSSSLLPASNAAVLSFYMCSTTLYARNGIDMDADEHIVQDEVGLEASLLQPQAMHMLTTFAGAISRLVGVFTPITSSPVPGRPPRFQAGGLLPESRRGLLPWRHLTPWPRTDHSR